MSYDFVFLLNLSFFTIFRARRRIIMGLKAQGDTTLRFHNLLILGNGADLCLGLHTRYADFLNYLYTLCVLYYLDYSIEKLKDFNEDLPSHLYQEYNLRKLVKDVTHIINVDHEKTKQSLSSDMISLNLYPHLDSEIINLACIKYFYIRLEMDHKYPGNNLEEKLRNYVNWGHNAFLQALMSLILAHRQLGAPFSQEVFSFTVKEQFYEDTKSTLLTCDSALWPQVLGDWLLGTLSSFYLLVYQACDEDSYLNGWLDVGSFIEFMVTHNETLENKFYSGIFPFHTSDQQQQARQNLIKCFSDIPVNPHAARRYLRGINDLNRLLRDFLLLQQPATERYEETRADYLDRFETAGSYYLQSAKERSDGKIESICLTSGFDAILDFNYTLSSELMFSRVESAPKIYHLHGRIDKDNLVFGYTRDPHTRVPSFCYPFEKRSQQILKHTDLPNYKKLLAEPFNLIIFGLSCSGSDSHVLKRLLEDENLITALVLCHSEEALVTAYNNLNDMIDPEVMDHLLRGEPDGSRHLYFAVEDKPDEQ